MYSVANSHILLIVPFPISPSQLHLLFNFTFSNRFSSPFRPRFPSGEFLLVGRARTLRTGVHPVDDDGAEALWASFLRRWVSAKDVKGSLRGGHHGELCTRSNTTSFE